MEFLTNSKAWYTYPIVSFIQVFFLCRPYFLCWGPIDTFKVGSLGPSKVLAWSISDIPAVYPPYCHDVRFRGPERRNIFLWRKGFTSYCSSSKIWLLSLQGKIKRTQPFYVEQFKYLKSLVPSEVCSIFLPTHNACVLTRHIRMLSLSKLLYVPPRGFISVMDPTTHTMFLCTRMTVRTTSTYSYHVQPNVISRWVFWWLGGGISCRTQRTLRIGLSYALCRFLSHS